MKLEDIIAVTDQIADPLERFSERRRLTRAMYAEQATAAAPKSEEDDYADDAEALASFADSTLGLRQVVEATPERIAEDAQSIADILEQMASIGPQAAPGQLEGHPYRPGTAERMRQNARILREKYAPPAAPPVKPVAHPARRSPSRPRARREHRVAQATSSTSSGEPHQPSRHAPGLAVCPLCTNEDLTRPRCSLCRGLGFVPRADRNRWKRGWRP